jgi:DNA-binding beta-propeller fold protein YncE
MGRRLLIVLCAALLGACDDPLVIIGDLPGFMRIIAGVPDSSGIFPDTIATRARLSTPLGLAVDTGGILYVSDSRSRILRVTSAGRIRVVLNQDPCFQKTCVGRPQGIARAPDGAILIADNMSDKVWRLMPSTGDLRALAGTGVNGVAPDGTLATQAPLSSPSSVGVLPGGRVVFAERTANRIRVINSDGTLGTLVADLALPTAILVAGDRLYFTENGNHTISALDLGSGAITRIGGNGGAGFSGDNGPALQASFNFPAALALANNNLFVSDQMNNRVRLINLATGTVTTFAGTGAIAYTGNGRAAGETSVWRPTALAVSDFGFLYIADSGHHVVWRTPIRANLQ